MFLGIMLIMKNIIGILAIALTFIAYIPYLRDLIKHKTQPHVFTWLVWATVALISFGLQIQASAGLGAFVTLAASIVCLTVFIIGLSQKTAKRNIKKIDVVFLLAAIGALIIWLLARQPVVSVIMLCAVDALGFMPTIRKSWSKPYSETLVTYMINAVRFCLALIALSEYNFVAAFYPFYWALSDILFCSFLIIRRKQVGRRK